MGDKITQLPVATTVDGTEVVPIVQGGATKQVTGAILRRPVGVAGGDLTGTYPNPTLAAITTAQSGVGSGAAIPVLTVDQKGRVTALTTVANPALTTNQIAGLTTVPAAALATTGVAGLSTFAARADHQHARPTPAEIGALGATAAAGGDLAGNFPNPVLASITTAQSNVGSLTALPVISTDAKGRVTALSTIAFQPLTTTQIAGLATVPAAALATTGVAGLSTFAARADHQHARPTPAEIGALGATAAAGGDLVGNFPNPTLAAITTAQSNVGSSTSVPVLSIDAKGRVTALGSTPIGGSAGGTVTSITAGTGLSGGTITSSGTIDIAAITTAQSNVGSATQIPVLSINAQGQVTALSSVTASGGTGSNASQIQGVAVSATPPNTSQTLVYNGTNWAPAAVDAAKLQGFDISTTDPTNGQWLVYNSTSQKWEPVGGEYQIEMLVVGGGGSGGSAGGGGGGGVTTTTATVTSFSTYAITVGAGGTGGSGATFLGVTGNNSSAFGVTALGGGGGGQWSTTQNNRDGLPGGSGGGAGLNSVGATNAGGAGTVGQGFAGGNSNQAQSTGFAAAGGGGASAVGGSKNNQQAGEGGAGVLNSINGSALYWSGGGGGGSQGSGSTPGNGGIGGGGGGANSSGGTNVSTGGGSALNAGGAGTASGISGNGGANTGGGGGGMAISIGVSGSGGSGIVIFRYLGLQRGAGGTVTSVGGYTIHTFTSSGNYTA